MPSAVKMRTDLTPAELRRLTASSKHANQSRRLLSPAAVWRAEISREKGDADWQHAPTGRCLRWAGPARRC